MGKKKALVAVVSGASPGVGRGIARVLGEKGATVYVTGRTQASGSQVSPGGTPLPGSINETTEEVTKAGGKGIPVAVDRPMMARSELSSRP